MTRLAYLRLSENRDVVVFKANIVIRKYHDFSLVSSDEFYEKPDQPQSPGNNREENIERDV